VRIVCSSLAINLSISTLFRTVAYTVKNPDVAVNLGGPVIAIFLLFVRELTRAIRRTQVLVLSLLIAFLQCLWPCFASVSSQGGFLITKDKIPNWLVWLYYISPFSWSVRSGALNEFHSGRSGYANGVGNTYLDVWQVSSGQGSQ
jgi:hypothetical protein